MCAIRALYLEELLEQSQEGAPSNHQLSVLGELDRLRIEQICLVLGYTCRSNDCLRSGTRAISPLTVRQGLLRREDSVCPIRICAVGFLAIEH